MRRAREHPRESRIAVSRDRAAARASWRLARLAQMIAQDDERPEQPQRGGQDQHARLHVGRMVEPDAGRDQHRGQVGVRRRVRGRQLPGEHLGGRGALRPIDARLHPPEDAQVAAAAALQLVGRAGLDHRVHADGHPHLRPEAEHAKSAEPARRHAGDGELGSVETDDAAHDVSVGLKPPAPAVVAQHHERIGSLGRVGGLEESPGGGRHAEHGEVVLGHHLAPHHVARHGPPDAPGMATLSGTPDIPARPANTPLRSR